MNLTELNRVAEAMVAPGRGILAADESSSTIKKRFDTIGVESTANTRRDYRELLFRSVDAMSKYISGVILYDETIRQSATDGTPLVTLIVQAGSLPGIKVDKGTKPLSFCPGEVITEGLDGLRERLVEYRGLGAKFAKWRAVIEVGAGIPSHTCISTNAHALAMSAHGWRERRSCRNHRGRARRSYGERRAGAWRGARHSLRSDARSRTQIAARRSWRSQPDAQRTR